MHTFRFHLIIALFLAFAFGGFAVPEASDAGVNITPTPPGTKPGISLRPGSFTLTGPNFTFSFGTGGSGGQTPMFGPPTSPPRPPAPPVAIPPVATPPVTTPPVATPPVGIDDDDDEQSPSPPMTQTPPSPPRPPVPPAAAMPPSASAVSIPPPPPYPPPYNGPLASSGYTTMPVTPPGLGAPASLPGAGSMTMAPPGTSTYVVPGLNPSALALPPITTSVLDILRNLKWVAGISGPKQLSGLPTDGAFKVDSYVPPGAYKAIVKWTTSTGEALEILVGDGQTPLGADLLRSKSVFKPKTGDPGTLTVKLAVTYLDAAGAVLATADSAQTVSVAPPGSAGSGSPDGVAPPPTVNPGAAVAGQDQVTMILKVKDPSGTDVGALDEDVSGSAVSTLLCGTTIEDPAPRYLGAIQGSGASPFAGKNALPPKPGHSSADPDFEIGYKLKNEATKVKTTFRDPLSRLLAGSDADWVGLPDAAQTYTRPALFEDPSEPLSSRVTTEFEYVIVKFTFKEIRGGGQGQGLAAAHAFFGQVKGLAASSLDPAKVKSIGDPRVTVASGSPIVANIFVPYVEEYDEEVDDPDSTTTPKAKKTKHVGPNTRSFPEPAKAFIMGYHDQREMDPKVGTVSKDVVAWDTTPPTIKFDPDFPLPVANSEPATTGDSKLLSVLVEDNNRFAMVRPPYLYYESAPAIGKKFVETRPLRLASEGQTLPPFSGSAGNSFKWRQFVPAPPNYIGHKAIRWQVECYDGSNRPNTSPPHTNADTGAAMGGNHTASHFGPPPAGAKLDFHGTEFGHFSLFDNDRPNITLKIYTVDGLDVLPVRSFTAGESHQTPDLFTEIEDVNAFRGRIPPDAILKAKGYLPPLVAAVIDPQLLGTLLPFEPFQVADQIGDIFTFDTDKADLAMFENRKYLFVLDAKDNVEYFVENGLSERTVANNGIANVKWQFRDPHGIRMGSQEELPLGSGLTNAGKGWYLGPEDPSQYRMGQSGIPTKVPTFEYIFKAPTREIPAEFKLRVEDHQGLERYFALRIHAKDVTNEFKGIASKLSSSNALTPIVAPGEKKPGPLVGPSDFVIKDRPLAGQPGPGPRTPEQLLGPGVPESNPIPPPKTGDIVVPPNKKGGTPPPPPNL